ncbi:MAG: ubiquinol-cytochrome c reductase iron-sulfur subunit [Gemmatimonadota bacterium]
MKPGRRTFLKWVTAVGSVLMGALVGLPGIRAFISPAFRRPQTARWIKLGEAGQIETGVPTRVDFSETIDDAWVETRVLRGVWIYTEDGEKFTVYNGRCTHLGCSYAFAKDRGIFDCPCHHGLFDLKTGAVIGGPPPRPLDILDVKVEGGILYVSYRDFREGIPEKIPVG